MYINVVCVYHLYARYMVIGFDEWKLSLVKIELLDPTWRIIEIIDALRNLEIAEVKINSSADLNALGVWHAALYGIRMISDGRDAALQHRFIAMEFYHVLPLVEEASLSILSITCQSSIYIFLQCLCLKRFDNSWEVGGTIFVSQLIPLNNTAKVGLYLRHDPSTAINCHQLASFNVKLNNINLRCLS
jgi:hypothetical protein